MRLLVFDHFFGQDIDAVLHAAGDHDVRVVSYLTLYRLAQKHFPPEVFTGLDEYLRPEHASARTAYDAAAREELHRIYLRFPFDAVIAPSDTFFYLRAWIHAAHELGLPFIVLQKETSISPFTMAEHARHIGRTFPFSGDLMTVCSERHKEFWINAGTPAEKIVVTGQPRFDLYSQPQRWKSWAQLGMRVLEGRETILFLSYLLDAYSPSDGTLSWRELRDETEDCLVRLARSGAYNLLIKPHPQQVAPEDIARIRAIAGDLWGNAVQWIHGEVDTRHLIVNAQIVVGFQTTALYEAMAAGKRVAYTFWSQPALRHAHELLPFHEMERALFVARSPEELAYFIRNGSQRADDQQVAERQKVWQEQLGPFDGHATERGLRLIAEYVAGYDSSRGLALRNALQAKASEHCKAIVRKARGTLVFWTLVRWFLPIMYPLLLMKNRTIKYDEYRNAAIMQRHNALEHIRDCRAVIQKARSS